MNPEALWFGSDESLAPYLRYLGFMENASASDIKAYVEDEDDEYDDELPALAQVEGSVGIININGSLVPNGNWFTRMFGMTGYDEIGEAAVALRDRDDVKAIVLSINSGGGSVMGLESLGDILSIIAKDKPVYSNTEGGMMSAAYWIGSIARNISSTPMAQLGSIGTIITHISVHRALKDSGRDVSIIRSGKFKAMGHSAEKLSPKAKQILQDQADAMTGFFRQQVEDAREGKLGAWSTWGEGQVFFTDEAISVGLSDRQVTLNGLVTQLNNKANHEETTDMKPKKKVILQDDQAAAQLESGVLLEDLEHQQVVEEPAPAAAAAENTSLVEGDEPVKTEAELKAEEDAGTKVELTAEPVDDSALVTHLKDEVATLREDLSLAKADGIGLKRDLDKVNASQEALIGIATNSVSKMQIGMGQTPASMSGLSADVIVEQHTAVQKQFNETFHVGQQSAAAPVEDREKAAVLPIDLNILPKKDA